ncbi:Transposase, orfB [Sphingobium herbicidovorans NBRC 16415]|uniref:Transposase, orfB n=2 Tax=Sphingobium herbicidovorans TaxID=76947 RepID=A0A086P7W3_SPHHM|nr:Transposase, orfB [Sphingobium herbicidovorans NBRC 16415]
MTAVAKTGSAPRAITTDAPSTSSATATSASGSSGRGADGTGTASTSGAGSTTAGRNSGASAPTAAPSRSSRRRPQLLSDNGPSYIAGDLADWLEDRKIEHIRGAPCHPQTQGKIERWHETMKNRVLLKNCYLPGDLKAQISAFVEHYNHRRGHESLNNLTPADVYFGRGHAILLERERIKQQTIQQRRLIHRQKVA